MPRGLRRQWDALLEPTPDPQPFDPVMLRGLPQAAQRWLTHAIAPGTPLRRKVWMRQHGRIRLRGRWWPLRAQQALDPLSGYLWPVTTRMAVVPLIGFDRLTDGTAEMRHSLLGRFPVMHEQGPDLVRSAAARAASEVCWAPAAALDPRVRWRDVGAGCVQLVLPLAGHDHELTAEIDSAGRLLQSTMPRWTSVDGGPWQLRTFGAKVVEEATFDGFTVPRRVLAGYGDGDEFWNDGAFIDLTVDEAHHL